MLLAKGTRLICEHKPYVVELADGARVPARAVMIATGAKYRKLAVENLSRFEGVGVYYGATFIEAQLCKDEEVSVVGGGNSAGQAAVFLAESAKHVFVVVRSDGLADTMSRYLIRRIEETPNITVLPHTEIVALDGTEHLGRVTWRNGQSGETIAPARLGHRNSESKTSVAKRNLACLWRIVIPPMIPQDFPSGYHSSMRNLVVVLGPGAT